MSENCLYLLQTFSLSIGDILLLRSLSKKSLYRHLERFFSEILKNKLDNYKLEMKLNSQLFYLHSLVLFNRYKITYNSNPNLLVEDAIIYNIVIIIN